MSRCSSSASKLLSAKLLLHETAHRFRDLLPEPYVALDRDPSPVPGYLALAEITDISVTSMSRALLGV